MKQLDDLSIDEILSMELEPQNNQGVVIPKKRKCPKCNGRKLIDRYRHKQGGRCYECNGKGYLLRV